ncbi:putative ribonuclease H-like domain-containing protein [Tanacetum coccineum]
MAREAEVKKQRVFNTGNGVAKPVWTNANRVNHANKLVPKSVQLNAGRPNVNTVRPNINTGRTKINPVRPRVNTGSSNVNTVRFRQPVPTRTSNNFSPKRPQGNWGSAVKTSAGYNWRNSNSNCDSGPTFIRTDHPLKNMVDRGIFDSGCSGHMTGNKDQLEDFEEFNGGSVTFGGSKGYISGKGRIRVGNLDFDSVSFVKELGHFNLFSISQICDKQHKVLFTETECLVVSSDFKMPDENQILLKVPRHHNMYSFDMKTPSPAKGFACLIAKATSDESKLWHRRLGHINFKNLNKLVKGNLVRGLPSKVFKNDHTCVACHKGKQHRASCKAKLERLITKPLHTLHMDLFGPTSVKSINHASYCLVITDDCTRFCWVFFLASKDETSGILQTFIRQIENQLSHRVKIIRSDNGTEFKNRDMLEFCGPEHDVVAPSQPSSSTPPVPSTSSPPVITTPTPIPATIPSPTPIPETEPEPFEHIFEEPSPVTTHHTLQEQPKEKWLWKTYFNEGLVKKVKKLEGLLKQRHVVLSDSEEEEPEAQGGKGRRYKRRKEAKGKKVVSSLDFQEEVDTGAEQVNTAEGVNTGSIKLSTVSEQLSTGSEQVSTVSAKKSTSSVDKGQREGKAPMISEETPKKSKEQILQEEASLAEAIRLDSLQKEEEAKQIHLDSLLAQRIAEEEELNEQQKKRKAQVQFEAQHYTNEDWDLIRAKIEANAELSKSMLGSELQGEDFAKKMVDLVNQRKKYFAEERAKAKRRKSP